MKPDFLKIATLLSLLGYPNLKASAIHLEDVFDHDVRLWKYRLKLYKGHVITYQRLRDVLYMSRTS